MPSLIRPCRGATLPELLIALTLLGIIAAVVGGVLRRTQDAYRAQTLTIDRAQNLRVASAFLPAELRELDATDGDIEAMAPTAITIRAPRQLAVLCQPPRSAGGPGMLALTVRDSPRYGIRDFNPRTDSLWVLRAGPTADTSAAWVRASIATMSNDTCPDGRPGRTITIALTGGPWSAPDAGLATGAPVLGFETLTYRLYRSSEDGRWYVGQQVGADLQPVLGPVTRDGLAFTYFDSSGAITDQPNRVSLVEIRVRAATMEPVRSAAGRLVTPVDSVVLAVALRNNRRD
jgi:prepilin-type N-terminal cleavage/methylation domain-containing protein